MTSNMMKIERLSIIVLDDSIIKDNSPQAMTPSATFLYS